MSIVDSVRVSFVKLWRGEQSIKKALWGFLVLGSFVAPFVAMVVALPFDFAGVLPMIRPVLQAVYFTGLIVYVVVAAVGTWRSANRLLDPRSTSVSNGVVIVATKLMVCVWVTGLVVRTFGATLSQLADLAMPS